MDKQETIERLCSLVSYVGSKFKHKSRTDCFCSNNESIVDESVINFIEHSTIYALSNHFRLIQGEPKK